MDEDDGDTVESLHHVNLRTLAWDMSDPDFSLHLAVTFVEPPWLRHQLAELHLRHLVIVMMKKRRRDVYILLSLLEKLWLSNATNK